MQPPALVVGGCLQVHVRRDQPDTERCPQRETESHEDLAGVDQQAGDGQDDHQKKDAVDTLMDTAAAMRLNLPCSEIGQIKGSLWGNMANIHKK